MKLPGSKRGASVGERGGLQLHPCTPGLAPEWVEQDKGREAGQLNSMRRKERGTEKRKGGKRYAIQVRCCKGKVVKKIRITGHYCN